MAFNKAFKKAFSGIENSLCNFDDRSDRRRNERDILVSSKNPNLAHYTVTATTIPLIESAEIHVVLEP